jgi:hypothetical protein
MGFWGILKNIRKRGLKDVTNPVKISNFLDFKDIKENGLTLSYDEIVPYCEQLVFRMYNAGCKPCMDRGACTHCECEQPGSAITPNHECDQSYYPPMFFETDGDGNTKLSINKWNDYKKEKGINFKTF